MKDVYTIISQVQDLMIQEYSGPQKGFRPISNGKFTPKKKKRKKKK